MNENAKAIVMYKLIRYLASMILGKVIMYQYQYITPLYFPKSSKAAPKLI
jgi:hypothetical protein